MRHRSGGKVPKAPQNRKTLPHVEGLLTSLLRRRNLGLFWIFVAAASILTALYISFDRTVLVDPGEVAVLPALSTTGLRSNSTQAHHQSVPAKSLPLLKTPGVNTGARFENGTEGYVADPTALKRGILDFLRQFDSSISEDGVSFEVLLESRPELYWKVLTEYEEAYRCGNPENYWKELTPYPGRYNCSTFSGYENLSAAYVCAGGPGQGFEGQGGYKILAEKIRVDGVDTPENVQEDKNKPPLRILCAMYTYHRMRDLARSQAISWGHKCDGFLAFSIETIPSLGMLELIHDGPESYDNMWQKTRSIWAYIAQHYMNDYDFFHLGGDDLYVIVENLRRYLSHVRQLNGNDSVPVYLGQWIPKSDSYFVGGAPGYTLNRAALARLINDVLPVCRVNARVSWEDRALSNCFRDTIGLAGRDTRDLETGEQMYHDCGPDHLYTFRAGKKGSFHAKSASFWESLPHPNPAFANSTMGPKHELDAAAKFSVNLHDLYHPMYTARIHSILFRHTCPASSALGRALRAHVGQDSPNV